MTDIKELLEAIAAVRRLREIVDKHDESLAAIQNELSWIRATLARLEATAPIQRA